MKTCVCCKQQFPIEEMKRSYCVSCKKELDKKSNLTRRKWNNENKDKINLCFKIFQTTTSRPIT